MLGPIPKIQVLFSSSQVPSFGSGLGTSVLCRLSASHNPCEKGNFEKGSGSSEFRLACFCWVMAGVVVCLCVFVGKFMFLPGGQGQGVL